MANQFDNAQVDLVESNLREIEKKLEWVGVSVCDAEGGSETWHAVNKAVNAVSEAIHSAWRMRPACAFLLAAGLSLCATLGRAQEIDRVALLDAIAMVESDRGATSRNIYQIRRIYWADVNRISGMNWHGSSYRDMVYFKAIAEDYINAFWDYYGDRYTKRTGKPVTAEVLARMHNGGPDGWRKTATASYWRRVRKHYLKNLKTNKH